MAELMYPGANRGEKVDRLPRVNRRAEVIKVVKANVRTGERGGGMAFTGLKPARTAESAAVPVKPKPKPARPSAAAPVKPKPKPARPSAVKKPSAPAFKANFKGAAPTAMQARGGARINRGGGLLGMIKRKLGK